MIRRFYFLFLLLILTIAFNRCSLDDFSLPNWQSEFIAPIINIEVGIDDLTFTDNFFEADSSGFLTLVAEAGDTIGTLEQLFPLDDQKVDFTLPGIPGAFPDFTVPLFLDIATIGIAPGFFPFLPEAELNDEVELDLSDILLEAEYDSGFLCLTIQNNLPVALQQGATFSIFNEGEQQPLVSFSSTSAIDPDQSLSLPCNDLTDLLLTGRLIVRIQNFKTASGVNVEVTIEDNVTFNFSYKDVRFERAVLRVPEIIVPQIRVPLPLIFPNGALLSEAVLDRGDLSIVVPDYPDDGTRLTLTLFTATQKGVPLSLEIGANEVSKNLDSLIIDLTQGVIPYNILLSELELNIPDTAEYFEILYDQKYEGQLTLTGIDYQKLTGYLGTSAELAEGKFEGELFSFIQEGKLLLGDPKINLVISNSQGLTGTLRDDGNGLYITGKNPVLYGEQEVTIGTSLEGFVLNAPNSIGQLATTSLEINAENEPNFNDFFALLPTSIEYRIPAKAGTDVLDFNQFLIDDGNIALSVAMELPMEITAQNLVLTDTVPFVLSFGQEDLGIQRGSLEARVTNFFPLNIFVQTYFLDSSGEVIDSLFNEEREVEAAELNPDGIVTEPSVILANIAATEEQLKRIEQADFAVPLFRLNTPDGKEVKIFSSYTVKMKVTGEILLDVNLNE